MIYLISFIGIWLINLIGGIDDKSMFNIIASGIFFMICLLDDIRHNTKNKPKEGAKTDE